MLNQLIEGKINTILKNYADAFVKADILKIIDFYTYPCCIRNQNNNYLFSKDEFKNNVYKLCKYYKTQNINKAIFNIKTISNLSDITQIYIEWQLIDNRGKIFSKFECIYQFELIKEDFKIFNVINFNEII